MSERSGAKKAEYEALLLERGMDPDQIQNFLTPGNKTVGMELILPPDKMVEILQALTKLSIVTQPVRVWFTFSSNRSEQFVETAEAVTGRKIVDGIRKPGELMN